jgi:hypothetical protein
MWLEEDKALLDHYSRKMTLHAALVVATVFGLFFILAIVSNTPSWVSRTGLTIAFAALAGFGIYEIRRYKYYGEMTHKKAVLFGAKDRPTRSDVSTFLFEKAELLFLVLMVWLLGFIWIGFFF